MRAEAAASPALAALLAATRDYVARDRSVARLLDGALDRPLVYMPLPPARLPAVDLLPPCGALAAPATARLTEAVLRAAPELCWRHTYTPEQVGDAFLARSGWFNLVSPEGPYVSQTCRISVGYWAEGLDYPDHAHAPEEIYLVLAGAAHFRRHGSLPELRDAGGTWHNPPSVMHGALMEPGPLLAMAFWTGRNLTEKSVLAAEARAARTGQGVS